MRWIRDLWSRVTKRSAPMSSGRFWSLIQAFSAGAASLSGIAVNSSNAMEFPAWLAGSSRLAETIAGAPLGIIQQKVEKGVMTTRRATDHYLWEMLHDAPNRWMTRFTMMETVMHHAISDSNAYCHAPRVVGRVKHIVPYDPDNVTPCWEEGELYYRVQGLTNLVPAEEMVHVRALSRDGIHGRSRVRTQREVLGTALATGRVAAAYFGNGAQLDTIFKMKGNLGDGDEGNAAMNRLRAQIEERHKGVENARKPLILEDDMDVDQLGDDPEKAQLIEAWRQRVTDVAAILGVPPHMVGDLTRATFSNIGQQSQEFLDYSVMPWVNRFEQEMTLKLLTLEERRAGYRVKFFLDEVLRADIATRFTVYVQGLANGIYSINDVRRMEGLNPIPGGDAYLRPLNMQPIDVAADAGEDTDAGDELAANPTEEEETDVTLDKAA